MTPRILVAGIGNIFLGDDGFGSEVARRLLRRQWPSAVRVEDFGVRGFDLTFALLDPYDAVILIDATPRGGSPGDVYVIEPDLSAPEPKQVLVETHGMNPMRVLAVARSMGARLKRVYVVGCEPEDRGDEERMEMSAPACAAVSQAAAAVERLVTRILDEGRAEETRVSGGY